MYSCFKGTECFSDEHLCFDLCWYNLQIRTYLSLFKSVLLITQHFYWFTTNFVELPQMNTFIKNVMFTAFQNLKMECFSFMSQATMYLRLVNPYCASLTPDKYHRFTIKPHWGLINFKHIWGGDVGGLFKKWGRGLFKIAKMIVSFSIRN